MNARPALLFLVASNKHTGPGRAALTHARLLAEAGFAVRFACQPGGSLQAGAEGAGLWCESGLALPTRGQVWSLASDVLRLRRLVRRHQVGALFCYRTTDHLLARVALGRKLPLVRHVHDLLARRREACSLKRRLELGLIFGGATAQVLSADFVDAGDFSGGLKDEATRRIAEQCERGSLAFAPGGVDTLHFHPDRGGRGVRDELGMRDEHVVIGLVSRIKAGRGCRIFLEALALAMQEEPRLRGLVVGGGDRPEKEALQTRARELGVASRVALFEPGIRYEEALAAIDVGCLLHPGSSGNAQAALELMSMARPMVVSSAVLYPLLAEVAEVVGLPGQPAGTGTSARDEQASAKGFAAAFLSLARDPDARMKRGRRSRELVQERFSRNVLQKQLVGLAERLCRPAARPDSRPCR